MIISENRDFEVVAAGTLGPAWSNGRGRGAPKGALYRAAEKLDPGEAIIGLSSQQARYTAKVLNADYEFKGWSVRRLGAIEWAVIRSGGTNEQEQPT